MKLRRFLCGGIALAGAAACALLATAEGPGTIVRLEGKTSVQFTMETETPLAADALDAELQQTVLENALKNRQFRYDQTVETTREAADLLGVPLLHSDVLEDMPLHTGKLQTQCNTAPQVVRTTYTQEYDAGSYAVRLQALTLWDTDYTQMDEYFVPDGYTLETMPCTTGTGQEVTVYYLQDEESRILRLFTVFSEENTWYTLYAYCDGYMVRDESGAYVPASVSKEACLQVLESLEPA